MGDYPPPTYEAASYRQLWPIVAPYIRFEDLTSACLVSREWHRSFAPQLWGNPASIFSTNQEDVQFSLSKFRRLLPVARLEVRSLVHTLQLQSASAAFYERPKPLWLRDVLDQLPALQTLIASRLSFFDHQTLQSIHQKYGESSANEITYSLKMLIASGCQNTTGMSLGLALQHFSDLIYLDLSASQGVRSPQVLRQIGSLGELRILKLRRCGLRDEDADYISFPRSLLSLDICDNLLTSRCLSKIFAKLPQARYGPPSQTTYRYSDVSLRDKLLIGGLEEYVRKNLARTRDGSLLIEEGLPLTFSQLFLTGNKTDIESITKSLKHLSLDHLDCGSLRLTQDSVGTRPSAPFSPKLEQMNPVSFTSSFGNLRSLRIHHSVLTTSPFFETEPLSLHTIEQDLEDNAAGGSLQLLTHKFLRHQREVESKRILGRFKPSMLPNLKVLTLTDLPTRTKYAQFTKSLVLFIQECAESENLARMEYLSQIQDQKEPPIWSFCPPTPLKLQKLILELSSTAVDHMDIFAQRKTQKQTQTQFTKSSTEDPDSEIFMQATEADFSFFDDDDDRDSNQLVMEGRVDNPAFGYERSLLEERSESQTWIEVIPELAAFRRESKGRFEAACKGRDMNMHFERVVSGHWIGEVRLIRNG